VEIHDTSPILKANKRLSFYGGGVNDEVFDALWENKGMEKVEELSFRYSSLTKSSYHALLNLEKLSDLDIEIDIDMMSDLADTIKFVVTSHYLLFSPLFGYFLKLECLFCGISFFLSTSF
jgi:hypothetical protein